MTDATPPSVPPPRERLTRLRVAGFRSIRSLDLDLPSDPDRRDLTILIGANGSGKSNLLSVFTLLSFIASDALQVYVQRRGGGSSVLRYGPKVTPRLAVQLTFKGPDRWSSYEFELEWGAPDRLYFARERVSFQRDGAPQPFTRDLGAGHTESLLPGLAAHDNLLGQVARIFLRRLKDVRAYHFHDTSETSSLRRAQDTHRSRHLLNHGGNLAAFLYMLQEQHPAHFNRILDTVREIMPYVRGLILAPDPLSPGNILLRWRDADPDYEFGPHQLSDGGLRTIALVTALMQPEDLLPAVITVDEPELGLHPAAVGAIASLLKAAAHKRQVLVATQSTRLLAEFAPEDVVVVRRDEDDLGRGETCFERLSRERIGAWLDDYDLGQLYDMNVTGGGPQ